ncbi:unnamed protein product [Phyllotreta striolata]|uniref:Gustatory receptor n=1 Tax=Phyllotreta striolata TaxID=444603 RepID=A0A9N9TSH9_PHYSR|nr:unnamed protein product [Phyllotreta striolata]
MFANFTFGLYSAVFVIVAVLMGCLGCFEKFALNSLRFVPIHPLKEIDETNNLRDLMGLMQYELCSEKHLIRDDLATQKASRTVEILRINHEEICVSIYDFNKCLDITFLFNTIVELGILIVDWYAVIAYLVYSFQEDEAFGLNILNIFFVLFHTYALFLFLKTFQQLKNMIHGLVTFLLEYSTRIYEPEEHQQVRLFIEKINNHRPFTACGVFTIDLGIAGPIAANILTYVLVALQFEVPDDE